MRCTVDELLVSCECVPTVVLQITHSLEEDLARMILSTRKGCVKRKWVFHKECTLYQIVEAEFYFRDILLLLVHRLQAHL